MTYSGSERTSSPTKSVMRSFAETKTIIPSTAKSVSGKTSEVAYPARVAASSWCEPGVEAPIGVNASEPVPPKRSAMTRTPMVARSSSVPWRNSATPSTATEPPRVIDWWSRLHTARTTRAATRTPVVSHTWMACRLARGAKASTRTPTRAPATTRNIGRTAR